MKGKFAQRTPMIRMLLMLLVWVGMSHIAEAQPFYYTLGTTTPVSTVAAPLDGANVFAMTHSPACANEVGALWCGTTIDFRKPFRIRYQASFDGLADGITVIFGENIDTLTTRDPTRWGGNLGYIGSTLADYAHSFAIETDIFNNGGGFCDMTADHMSIDLNGNACPAGIPSTMGLPVQADPMNPLIKNTGFRDYEIIWDPATNTLLVYCDCILRINSHHDYRSVFTVDSTVRWGFNGATAHDCNHNFITGITLDHPVIDTVRHNICVAACPITIKADTIASDSATSFYWSYGNAGTTIATIDSVTDTCGRDTSVYHSISYVYDPAHGVCDVIIATHIITVGHPGPITGVPHVCVGQTTTLADTASGGTWSSYNTGIATVGSSSGVVTGVSPGIDTIYYTLPAGCRVKYVVTVTAMPASITGPTEVCVGQTITLADATPGGTWSSSSPPIGTVNAATGVVGGRAAGTITITYTIGGCIATYDVTVNPISTPITGPTPSRVCTGATINLGGVTPGGTWSSGSSFIGTVDASGVVTGLHPGTVTISYTMPGGCAVTRLVTVYLSPGPIGGSAFICTGNTTTLTDPVPGGTWSTTAFPVLAVINPVTGLIAGGLPGTGVVTYTMPGGCIATKIMTVIITPPPVAIVGPSTMYEGCTYTLTGLPGLIDATTTVTWSLVVTTPGTALGTPTNTVLSSVEPITAGTPGGITVRYTLTNACGTRTVIKRIDIIPKPVIQKIDSARDICKGDTIGLGGFPTGGVWTSSDPTVAVILPPGNLVTGIGVGTSILTYSLPLGPAGCVAIGTTVLTVHPTPGAISGSLSICDSGGTTTLTSSTPGGTWTSSDPTVGTVDPTSGVVTGIGSGTTIITYTLPPGLCFTTAVVHVMIGAPLCICDSLTAAGAVFNELDPGHTGAIAGIITGNLYLDHNVTVNSGTAALLRNCVLVIAPGVSITVNSRALMQVTHSHLFCCYPNMWQGIILSTALTGGGTGSTGQLILNNNTLGSTLIEDAQIAVDITAPVEIPGYTNTGAATNRLTLFANGVTFNKNTAGIIISNYTTSSFPVTGSPVGLHPSYPFVVENAVFTCRDLSGFASWPFAWPRNDGAPAVGALKAVYAPTNPYTPPYLLETYPLAVCNNGALSLGGIGLNNVGTTTGTGIGSYSGVIIGSAAAAPGVAARNVFDNMEFGMYAVNSNLGSRNSVYMHIHSSAIPFGGTGIHSERNTAGAASGAKYVLDVYGNATGYRNEFWDCSIGVNAQDLYAVRGIYSLMSSKHRSTVLSDPQGQYGYKVAVAQFYDVQITNNVINNMTTGIKCDVTPPTSRNRLVGQISASYNAIRANAAGGASTPFDEYVHTGISVQALVYPYSGGVVAGSEVNIDFNGMDHVYNGIVLSGFSQKHQAKTTRVNAVWVTPDLITTVPYTQAGILHVDNLRDYIETNYVLGVGYNTPTAPSPIYTPSATPTQTILEGIHCSDEYATQVCNNIVRDINTGFYFGGTNDIRSWVMNIMWNNAYGYILDGNIGAQPAGVSPPFPMLMTGNTWMATGGFSWTAGPGLPWQTYTIAPPDFTFATGSPMMVANITPTQQPTQNGSECGMPYDVATGGIFPTSPPNVQYATCTLPPPSSVPLAYRQPQSGRVVVPASRKWIGQMQTWKAVADDASVDSSAELYSFKQLAAGSRYRYLTDIEHEIANGNYEQATQMLDQPLDHMASDASDPTTGIVLADKGGDDIVVNYKQYYQMLVKYKTNKMNRSDSSMVMMLANKCPFVDGPVIFNARSLYNLVFNDHRIFNDIGCAPAPELNADNDEVANVTTSVNDNAVKALYAQSYQLYPNPSDGNITLTQKIPDNGAVMAEVWSATGASVFKGQLHFEDGKTDLKVINASAGMYMLQLIDSKGNRSSLKFVISGN